MNYIDLLKRYDLSESSEGADDFDYSTELQRFLEFKKKLEEALGIQCNHETGLYIQDASFHSELYVPLDSKNQKLNNQEYLNIRFSSFGNFVAYSLDSEIENSLSERIISILEKNNYIFIPQKYLEEDYDGKYASESIPDYWTRYFDYL